MRTPVADATWLDAEPARNRIIHMVNWNKRNPGQRPPVGYKFAPSPSQLLLADPRSRMAKRALFAKHHVWVTGYRDGELWAAGEFTNLSKQRPAAWPTWSRGTTGSSTARTRRSLEAAAAAGGGAAP